MSTSSADRDPLDLLAEEFVERYRRGERPALTEYAGRHPELADRIRDLFPALVLMEQLGSEPPADPPRAPDRLGEYRVVREVGRGGMGVVYEAVQESLGRRVALKVLPAERCRGKFLDRFRREARAAARLHHTNIVPVFGVGQDGDTHFYVMQYIDGRGLDRLLAEVRQLRGQSPEAPGGTTADPPSELARSLLTGLFPAGPADTEPLTPPPAKRPAPPPSAPADDAYHTVARLGLQAAEALEYAHSQGVLHRDVKPSNLLLDGRGTLWVADFGLAKADDGADLTHTDDLLGTVRYMAPERFRGQADPRSDVYSLGATLYELLALRPAFDGPDRLGLMDAIAHGSPAPLRQLAPRVPRDLETVVGKALAREPRDRYAAAGELAEDLGRFLADRPIRARRAGPVELLLRWARRCPAVAALAAAVVLLLTVSAGGGWWAAGRLSDQVATVSRAERDTTERLWEARLAQARAGRASRLPGQRFHSLDALADAARIRPSPELRNEAVACLALVDVRLARRWAEDLETDRLGYSTGAAFDPDLAHYAFSDAAGTVRVCSAEDGRERARLAGGGKPVDYLRFSPDGRYLAARDTHDPRRGRVWDWRSGKTVLELAPTKPFALVLDFHPDGREVAVGRGRAVDVFALPEGRRLRSLPLGFEPGWLAYEPRHGRSLAACGSDEPRLVALDGASGRPLADWRPPALLYAVAWQPGGSLLAASSADDGAVYTYDVDARAPRLPLLGHLLEAREVAFSPDGGLLATRG